MVSLVMQGASEATAEIVEGVSSGDEPSSKPENLPSPSEAVEAVQQVFRSLSVSSLLWHGSLHVHKPK